MERLAHLGPGARAAGERRRVVRQLEENQGGASLSPGSYEPGSWQGPGALNCIILPCIFVFIAKPVQLKL